MASKDQEANVVSGDTGPGTGLKDLLPVPAENTGTLKASDSTGSWTSAGSDVAGGVQEGPTLSHALATEDHDQKGHAQLDHEKEVKDLGWNEPKHEIPAPIVGGMDNEELWLLVRRFNKQIYHLKSTPYPVPGGLDLNVADDEEFSPDKLRTTIERLYMTVGVGMVAAVKHIARLRSWREKRRTSYFAAAYFMAWLFDLIVPLLSAVVITLIVYPPSREFLFPPAPVALVDSNTGGVQKPRAGVLGSHDSATGAPENHKGEAVEQEASNFVEGIATMALSSASAEAKDQAAGSKKDKEHDKTKVPMETAMWTKARPVMQGLGDLADTWERFANALSPTPPFPQETSRLRIATLVIPTFGISLFVTSYMFIKGLTFGIGFGFFGDPVISRGLDWLNRTIPNWKQLIELRNTVLKGVPTNAQLTITLLRIGEANKAPLPPPPRIREAPPAKPAELTDEHLRSAGGEAPLDASPEEIRHAIQHNPEMAPHRETDGPDLDAVHGEKVPSQQEGSEKKKKKGSRIINFFKNTTAGFVHTGLTADTVRAKVGGSHHAKDRLGVVPPAHADAPVSGPVEFKARYDGKKGHVYLSTAATIPMLAFGAKSTTEKIGGDVRDDLHPLWSIAVADIAELKKIGGFGWKAKLVVGWSLEREVADGLEITTKEGQTYKITACPLRDELFNRLCAMGAQKWVAW